MFTFDLIWVFKGVIFAFGGIILKQWTVYVIKQELKKHPPVDSMASKIPNTLLRHLVIFTFYLIATIMCCALLCTFFIDQFINLWILTSLITIPFVFQAVYKEIKLSNSLEK